MPKVSVIVPNYNHSPYLKRRIDSILNQTYQDFELILLDDCSTDNSADVLREYGKHPKVSHVVINETNSGSTFKQWHKGFSLAQGEYIWIAESDDWCEVTLLENLVPALEQDDKLVLAYVQSVMVTDKGNIEYKTEGGRYAQAMLGRDFVATRMFGDTSIINCGMAIFRKSVLAKVDPIYENTPAVGDWLFWISVALQGDVYISGKYLNYFFRHEGTVTSKSVVSGNDFLQACKVFQYVKEHVRPTESELNNALNLRVREYMMQRKLYATEEIKTQSKNMLFSLDKRIKNIYYKILIKRFLKIN